MKVLFDANVVLDILLKRPGWSESSEALASTAEPWISALTIANIAYIIGRSRRERLGGTVERLQSKFFIASFGGSSIARALRLEWNDFEDAIQIAIAHENKIPWLVTRNLDDFQSGETVTVVGVADLLMKLRVNRPPAKRDQERKGRKGKP